MLDHLRRYWRHLLARFRLSDAAVCAESAELGPWDYHDWRDSEERERPGYSLARTCKRCGKAYYVSLE